METVRLMVEVDAGLQVLEQFPRVAPAKHPAREPSVTRLSAGLTLLTRASRALYRTLDVDAMLKRAFEELARTFGASGVLVHLLSEEGTLERSVGHWLSEAHGREVSFQKWGIAQIVREMRRPLVLRDITEHRDIVHPAHFAHGVKSLAAFPIMGENERVLGVLLLYYTTPQRFPDSEVQILSAYADHLATALENARLFAESERQRRAAEALLDISQALGSTLDLRQVLKIIAQRTAQAVGAERCSINLWQDGRMVPVMSQFANGHAEADLWAKFRAMGPYRLEEVPAHAEAIHTKRPVAIQDAAATTLIPAYWTETFGIRSALVVPLVQQEAVVGTMTLDRADGPYAWRQEVIDLAMTIANQAALAVKNAGLYHRAEERAEKLTTLSTLTRLITSVSDNREVSQAIARATTTLLGAKLARVWVDDPVSRVFRVQGSFGIDPKFEQVIHDLSEIPYGKGLVGAVFEARTPEYLEDLHEDSRVVNERLTREVDLHAFSGLPLMVGDRVMGVLAVIFGDRRAFTPEEKEIMALLADQAAISLENSRLYGELRKALETVEASQRHLVQTERIRALGEMAGGVAHDFNNVLAVILARAQLLHTQSGDPEFQRQLKVIQKAALDGAQTVRRIQEFTRRRRARPFQRVDLNQVIEEVVGLTRSRWKDEAQGKGTSYDVRLEPSPILPVAGDPSELREALANLLFNALDAMPEGGRVTLATRVEGERVTCAVADTGIGMTEDVKRRVFDPFFTTKNERGNGLGLSMVYGIINRHGGEIEVESEPGRGSVFTIRLPVGRDIPETPAAGPAPTPTCCARILVVDDEAEVGELLSEFLASQGHSVRVCTDGGAAVARLEEEAFDLVVTDLGMPGVSGWEVAAAVKRKSHRTPVVLLTGWGDQIDPAEVQERRVDFVVSKPFTFEDVQAAVAAALKGEGGGGGSPRTA